MERRGGALTRLTMLMMKKGSQHRTKTTTITTTMRVTFRSERLRVVNPALAPDDFTWKGGEGKGGGKVAGFINMDFMWNSVAAVMLC